MCVAKTEAPALLANTFSELVVKLCFVAYLTKRRERENWKTKRILRFPIDRIGKIEKKKKKKEKVEQENIHWNRRRRFSLVSTAIDTEREIQ